jgi:hypothetical protein
MAKRGKKRPLAAQSGCYTAAKGNEGTELLFSTASRLRSSLFAPAAAGISLFFARSGAALMYKYIPNPSICLIACLLYIEPIT